MCTLQLFDNVKDSLAFADDFMLVVASQCLLHLLVTHLEQLLNEAAVDETRGSFVAILRLEAAVSLVMHAAKRISIDCPAQIALDVRQQLTFFSRLDTDYTPDGAY